MSLKASELPPILEQTQRSAKAVFKKNNLYIKMRDAFEVFLKDEQFAPVGGKWQPHFTASRDLRQEGEFS